MEIPLAYGRKGLDINLDTEKYEIEKIMPKNFSGLKNPKEAFANAIGKMPGIDEMRKKASRPDSKTVIVISDHTRPVPDRFLVPWVVEELGIPDRNITILVGTGTHRDSTEAELNDKLGEENLKRFRVVNHHCNDMDNLVELGVSSCGGRCFLNKLYLEADLKICTGFIEPHFFAGFSGGAKSLIPGIAGLETIKHFHRARLIAEKNSTWGLLKENSLQSLAREMASLCPPDFIVNVTMNLQREMTGIFAGSMIETHERACAHAAKESIVRIKSPFPVVITSNSGYPLDQNFYQTVKGISAASRIVEDGGTIIIASECANGLPSEGEFGGILSEKLSDDELLKKIMATENTRHDQWQAQTLLQCRKKSRIILYSAMTEDIRKKTRTEHSAGIEKNLEEIWKAGGCGKLKIAVMPLGPLTIPVLE